MHYTVVLFLGSDFCMEIGYSGTLLLGPIVFCYA